MGRCRTASKCSSSPHDLSLRLLTARRPWLRQTPSRQHHYRTVLSHKYSHQRPQVVENGHDNEPSTCWVNRRLSTQTPKNDEQRPPGEKPCEECSLVSGDRLAVSRNPASYMNFRCKYICCIGPLELESHRFEADFVHLEIPGRDHESVCIRERFGAFIKEKEDYRVQAERRRLVFWESWISRRFLDRSERKRREETQYLDPYLMMHMKKLRSRKSYVYSTCCPSSYP